MQIRGFHIDLRAQTMRVGAIIDAMRDAASWGYNTLLLEYCDKFPYRGRLADAVAPDALTRNEIVEINKAASDLGMQIIPLVQCLGHMYWALRIPNLRDLGEGASNPNCIELAILHGNLSSLCPSRPSSRELFMEMVDQVLQMHPNCRYLHMGGDEVFMDDECPLCAPRRELEGVAGVMGGYYAETAEWLKSKGPEPIMWCDMLLAHPESLDMMRGKATIMDWDYWSTSVPYDKQLAWGVPWDKHTKPEEWPKSIRETFAPLFFTEGEGRTTPFPYNKFLVDKGFQVINGPAIRSCGDSFCVPKETSVENVIASVKTAHKNHTLGTIITSWALRRAPWPTTEYALIAGGMTMMNPEVTREEIDARFAEEHFGVADPELGRIPVLLGSIRYNLIESNPSMDVETGNWFGNGYDQRIPAMKERFYPNSIDKFKETLTEVKALLEKAEPKTDRQHERMKFWQWAYDLLAYFTEFTPQVYKDPGTHDIERLTAFRKRAEELERRTAELLSPMLTDWCMLGEQQTRFGIHLEWIDKSIKA